MPSDRCKFWKSDSLTGWWSESLTVRHLVNPTLSVEVWKSERLLSDSLLVKVLYTDSLTVRKSDSLTVWKSNCLTYESLTHYQADSLIVKLSRIWQSYSQTVWKSDSLTVRKIDSQRVWHYCSFFRFSNLQWNSAFTKVPSTVWAGMFCTGTMNKLGKLVYDKSTGGKLLCLHYRWLTMRWLLVNVEPQGLQWMHC